MNHGLWSGRRARSGFSLGAFGALVAAAAMALAPPVKAQVLDEVWIGGYAHDISDLGHGKESGTQDVQLEIDTGQPQILRFLGAPRLDATVAINTRGDTDLAGVGLAWDRRLFGPLSASLQFGIAESDGVARPPAGPAGDYDNNYRLLLGSKTLFREAVGLDWRLAPRWALGVQYVHASNGGILGHRYNEGINDLGMRLGYRFR